MENKTIIDLVKQHLNDISVGFLEIYLFGSRSRGDFNEDSDYDIMIVLKDNLTAQAKRKLSAEIRKFLIQSYVFVNIDLIIKNFENWDWECRNLGFLSYTVKREGVLL